MRRSRHRIKTAALPQLAFGEDKVKYLVLCEHFMFNSGAMMGCQ